ncbi:hypothetical protein POSPLADRAFT_1157939 [Postia placenta MAD-698-R-SB12]|uniref:Cytochrome P450 monooxygenase pc-3 n=1 Tax=Postia placenta MAD-698-R-SB12 TaxID=670580 RepID=A0A1X6ML33_9APHY|nr:hypothetical protein POSPLADRAFT_1157939 [Postia placenta MAD-698-R-SB12]OSX57018.1 hypothetical protein POSPLADRAFT_1157939 [Postia placenta MAD-698-R-SB12]
MSPGPRYLARQLPRLLLPPTLVYILYRAIGGKSRYSASPLILTFLFVLSYPVSLAILVQWKRYTVCHKAASLGAVLPPTVKHRWIGGIDLVVTVSRNFEKYFLVDWLFKWSAEYGHTFAREVLFERRLFTSEPEHIKSILSTNFQAFEKGSTFRGQLGSLLGTGVFNSDGQMWKFHRSMTRPFFTKERISHFDIFDRNADAAFALMKARFREGHSIDWQDLVLRFTLDSATEFLFGNNVCSLAAGLPYPPASAPPATPTRATADGFGDALKRAQFQTLMRMRFGSTWPLFEFWSDKVHGAMHDVDAFVDPIVQRAVEAHEAAKGAGAGQSKGDRDHETLLGHLVGLTDDPQILKDETLNILIAGRDTTAAALTFAVYSLARHSGVLLRLRREVLGRVGTVRRPEYEDFKEMKYLRAVINETLRLYPPLICNDRYTTEAVLWPSRDPGGKPLYIPAKTRIQYSVFVMHRRKDLWGPDALSFDPDRFLDERMQKYLIPNPFIFLPFNAGPRVCLGQQFAYSEVSFMLVRLLQQFETIELTPQACPNSIPPPTFTDSIGCEGTETAWVSSHLTIFAKNGLWLKMCEAPFVDMSSL